MPQYLQSLIPEEIGTKRPQSRNPDNFYSLRSRIETYRLSFIPPSVRLYNSLDMVDRSFEYANSLMKRPSPSLFYHGTRSSGIKHAQLRIGQINVTSEKTREIAGRQKGYLISYTYSEESSPTCALSSITFYLLSVVL